MADLHCIPNEMEVFEFCISPFDRISDDHRTKEWYGTIQFRMKTLDLMVSFRMTSVEEGCRIVDIVHGTSLYFGSMIEGH